MGSDITYCRLPYRPSITGYRKLYDDTSTYTPGWPTSASIGESAFAHNDAHYNINTLINTNTKGLTVITEAIVFNHTLRFLPFWLFSHWDLFLLLQLNTDLVQSYAWLQANTMHDFDNQIKQEPCLNIVKFIHKVYLCNAFCIFHHVHRLWFNLQSIYMQCSVSSMYNLNHRCMYHSLRNM